MPDFDDDFTLRDYFAGEAVPQIIEHCNNAGLGMPEIYNAAAKEAYLFADAMMAERQKGKAP